MALTNWADSLLNGYQARVQAGLSAPELRELDTAVLAYALANTQFYENLLSINPVKQSFQRPVYGYQFNRVTTAVGSAMTTFPSGALGTTVQIPLTFVTFTYTFATLNVSGYDNVEDFARIFDNSIGQGMRQIRTAVRQWLTTNIYTNRTTVLPSVNTNILGANWNSSTDCWEVGSATPYATIQSVMRQSGYGYSTYDTLMDPLMYVQYSNSISQGSMNATNQAWQFDKKATMPQMGGYFDNIWEDLNLGTTVPVEAAYTNGTCLVMPKQAFAMIPWTPYIYYDPSRAVSFDSYTGGYGTIGDDKYNGIEYQLFGWNNQYDSSGGYGQNQSQMQNWQIGYTVAFRTAYMSNTGETAIYQFSFVNG